tara:strand:- start:34 stop:324 length:291 start_codon:yes stop_codon:yes gene_type:complete
MPVRTGARVVAEGHVEDIAHHRTGPFPLGRDLGGQASAHECPATEPAAEGDDGSAPGGGAGDLDAILDRPGPGGDEDGILLEVAGPFSFRRSASRT